MFTVVALSDSGQLLSWNSDVELIFTLLAGGHEDHTERTLAVGCFHTETWPSGNVKVHTI